ncbi:Crp/Fnr family transcriptional regulator [Rapidithrix thailandica]|uniref:Crp/Fnr family transcriptional regulator n=1 Tax=Rapidithrix thailandica TaxID=413964 RepID=A0AAW9SJU6_9BACT
MYELILQNISKHIQFTEEETSFFISMLKKRKLRKRQFLVQKGDICKHETFVIKGCLRAIYTTPNAQEYMTQFAMEDWWINDFESFLTGKPATLDIEALEDCTLLQIDYPSLQLIYERIPKFERFSRLMLEKSYLSLYKRMVSSMSKPAEERYQDFLKQYPNLHHRIPQYHIAAYLGITPEFLSKIRKKLAKQ